jgi:hypothetical protein
MRNLNLIRGQKQDYFVILFAVILVVIVLSIVYISFTAKPSQVVQTPSPTATIPTETLPPIPFPVQYDYAAEDRLAKIITQRPPLSQSDSQQKTTMLNTILHGFNSGVLYETDNVRIEYVQSADLFMAEIKTTSFVKAKAEATSWFLSQGLSQKGICTLPVMFFLDPEVSQALQGQDIIFSPLPNSC